MAAFPEKSTSLAFLHSIINRAPEITHPHPLLAAAHAMGPVLHAAFTGQHAGRSIRVSKGGGHVSSSLSVQIKRRRPIGRKRLRDHVKRRICVKDHMWEGKNE